MICALLVTTNKDKYKWLVTPTGFKNDPKIAIAFYSILGAVLMISGFVNISYINYFILPAFVLFLSLLTILIINSKKSNEAS
ncbi:hypothetical protein KO561_02980 [Radiobacillus kanasensis]|uniref:hypothetical protein n=1 Tax=Radiobacillus kanasensis TaxID=2844358 RepID=UPI001E488F26|nr:hypothetical protein [Radiobacillus kanasensis]UFT99942.1 hypothetical protein KO561_02980 [Radiobacillus kanasensis]